MTPARVVQYRRPGLFDAMERATYTERQPPPRPPSSAAAADALTANEAMHGSLLAAVLAFLDLDTLASAALCCRDWHR